MTEETLFRATLMTLGATIVGPLFVAATNIAGTPEGAREQLKSYVAAAEQTANEKKDTPDEKDVTDKKMSNEAKTGANQTKTDTPATPAASAQSAGAKTAGSYTVKAGDTYGCIAEKYYGSYDQWTRVYDRNSGWPGFGEYDLAVGATLQMPAISTNEALPKTHLCS